MQTNDIEYIKILLDSSFKESGAFWKRNTAYLIGQGAFAGLYLGDFDAQSTSPGLAILATGLGICLCTSHLGVLLASRYYNHQWLKSTIEYAQILADKQTDSDPPANHLLNTLTHHRGAPFAHSTSWAMLIPIVFAAAWIGTLVLVMIEN